MTAADICRADWLCENLVIGRSEFDPVDLRRVAMTKVLQQEAQAFLEKAEGGPKAVAKALGRYDPDIRSLLALTALMRGWYHHYQPRELLRHIFCGGWGNVAPEMVDALAAAGATKQEVALRTALGHFPERMRRDAFRRSQLFGEYWGPPNALTIAMSELGEAFGTRAELVQVAADYTAGRPALIAWCETQRRALDEDERLGWLIDTLIQRFETSGGGTAARERLAAIPNPYRALYLAAYAEFEVYNGGISQYFTNSSGQFAPLAVEAFETIGLPKQAAVIAKGVAMFSDPFPDDVGAFVGFRPGGTRRDEPNAEDRRWSRDWHRKLERLTKGWGDWGAIRAAITAYAKREGAVPA